MWWVGLIELGLFFLLASVAAWVIYQPIKIKQGDKQHNATSLKD